MKRNHLLLTLLGAVIIAGLWYLRTPDPVAPVSPPRPSSPSPALASEPIPRRPASDVPPAPSSPAPAPASSTPSGAPLGSEIVAQVGDVTITLHDLSELNGLRDDQTRLNELIARALLLRETKKRRLSVPDPVVEGRIAEIITSQFGGNRAAFEASLTARGETLDHYRQSEREKVEILSARQLILREVGVTARPRPEQEAALRQWLAARREETAVTFPSLPR